MITRDPIHQALFNKLKLTAGLVTTDRVLRHWNDVKHPEQPALFVTAGNEAATASLGRPTVWNLSAKAYIYVRTEKGTVPATVLNSLIDSIELSLKPDPQTGQQTLDGMCHHCYMSAVEHDEGLLGQQGVAIISFVIQVV
jgi:hypothetical protein